MISNLYISFIIIILILNGISIYFIISKNQDKCSCANKQCGSDGCNKSCGMCGKGKVCIHSKCVSLTPSDIPSPSLNPSSIIPNPPQRNSSGKTILTPGYFLDNIGKPNFLMSEDKQYAAFVNSDPNSSSGFNFIVTPNIPGAPNYIGGIIKVEISDEGNLLFYNKINAPPANVKTGGSNSYLKFDSFNILSFFNKDNKKVWDIKSGDYN